MRSMFSWLLIPIVGILATSASLATTQHDNEILINTNPGALESFKFVETGHNITAKQPYGGVSSEVRNQNSQGRVVVKAGRKGSTGVADWFRTQLAGGSAIACDSTGTSPNKLNFAVKGNLTLKHAGKNITCQDFTLGQGHFTGANNWWIGSNSMKREAIIGIQNCKTADGKTAILSFQPELPCTHNFTLKFVVGTEEEAKK